MSTAGSGQHRAGLVHRARDRQRPGGDDRGHLDGAARHDVHRPPPRNWVEGDERSDAKVAR